MVWDCIGKHVTAIVTIDKMNRFIRNLNFEIMIDALSFIVMSC